jgi:methyl-accepting chemotaxis protein
LYNGIKDLVSGNYNQRLNIDGNDEISEISMAFNEMAERLKRSEQKMSVPLQDNTEKALNLKELEELKTLLLRIKSMEDEARALISKIENKQ